MFEAAWECLPSDAAVYCGFNSEGLELGVGNRGDRWRTEQLATKKMISDTFVELRLMEWVLNEFIVKYTKLFIGNWHYIGKEKQIYFRDFVVKNYLLRIFKWYVNFCLKVLHSGKNLSVTIGSFFCHFTQKHFKDQ